MSGRVPYFYFVLVGAAAFAADQKVSFNRDIRPIMADTCFRCHGPDKSSRMANMRLDIRDEALKPTRSGVTPIVPGKPDESAIIQRIFASNPAKQMPPKYAHKDLTQAQKDTIRRWVEEGAVYEGHWAYLPVRRPAVPQVAADAKAPIRNPIDAFIQERLAREGLTPSPEADRRTLIRRVWLDLVGLPPTPADVEAFVNDKSPDAYEKVVDRLLVSPHYAEKQAAYWLDAVRYADTCGFHGDNIFPAWPYRDYVLRAFRDNKPFDVFAREQLAGDLLPNATDEQKVASAYNRLNRTSAEGGIQAKEYLAKYGADRVRTTSATFLGSTMGCAECHDHKFDPFTSRDFYSMKAFFADIKETGFVNDRGPKAWGTQIELPSLEQKQQQEYLRAALSDARKNLAEAARSLKTTQSDWEDETLKQFEAGKLGWTIQRPLTATSANGAVLKIYNDEPVESTYYLDGSIVTDKKPGRGLVVASGPNPDNETYTVTFRPGAGEWTALAIESVHDDSLPGTRVARGADRFVVTEVEVEHNGARMPIVLATTAIGVPNPELPAMAGIDGNPKTGWGLATYNEERNPTLALRFGQPLSTTDDSTMTVRIHQDSDWRRATIGRFRVALSSARYSWPTTGSDGATDSKPEEDGIGRIAKALRQAPEDRFESDRKAIDARYLWSQPELTPLVAEVARLEARASILDSQVPRSVVTVATTPVRTRILPRGNWMDDTGDVVQPSIPAFLGKLDTGGRRATRLDLANWIASTGNPLTARVFVNRVWRQFFGTGISKMLDDLGSQGEWPSHPELLDWLAAEFMKPEWQAQGTHAWDVKHIIRAIALSHTYRQSSLPDPPAAAKDPDNRLLARQNRFRVDAELVRDVALSVSGLLNEDFGGPSVKPFQPDGYLATLNFPKREYSASRGKDLYRRGVYTLWQRSFLHPTMTTFDAPTREECTVNRTNSNTPLQALVLLNDPIFVEAARVFAQNAVADGGATVEDRIQWAFLRAAGRPPSDAEKQALKELHETSLKKFRSDKKAAEELIHTGEAPARAVKAGPDEVAAMTMVTRAILNMHETITRN